MQKTFPNEYFPSLKRVQQITSSHCAPAALEMLLSFVGIEISQEAVVEAAGVAEKLALYGMTVPEMAMAVKKLVPDVEFWYKNNSTLADLQDLVTKYQFPVGVEWQGVFYEDADDDNGHYGVITHIDTVNNIVFLSDPYRRFAGVDRRFHVLEFEERWWDENEIRDPLTGRQDRELDYHMMFIVTPKDETFPEALGMVRG